MNLNYSNANIIKDLSKLSSDSTCDILSVNYHNNKPVIIDFIKSFKNRLSNFNQQISNDNLATLQYLSSNLDKLVTIGESGANIQGTQGIKGISGDSLLGARGDQGIQGLQGIKGQDSFGILGDQGIQGVQGVQGPDQIINYVQGTVSYYISNSTGPKGDQGSTNNLSSIQGAAGFRTIPMTNLVTAGSNSYKLDKNTNVSVPGIHILVTASYISMNPKIAQAAQVGYASFKSEVIKNINSQFHINLDPTYEIVYYMHSNPISNGEGYRITSDDIVPESLTRFYKAPDGLQKCMFDKNISTRRDAYTYLQGTKGYTFIGLQGAQGIQGILGPKGDDVEIIGAKGDKGPIGLQGVQGEPGDNGSNGNSYFHDNEDLTDTEVTAINNILYDCFGVKFSWDSNGNLVITSRDVIGV